MTQEEKELLLKDLCGRLPHMTIVATSDNDKSLENEWELLYINAKTEDAYLTHNVENATKLLAIEEVKPYLFPLSSMTEDQRIEYGRTLVIFNESHCSQTSETYDWLNKNHFDYRGLIEKGLAIDATGLNIYY